MEAPRSVPPYERTTIHTSWWYCLYCKKAEATEDHAKSHVRTAHLPTGGAGLEVGEDYTNGAHLHIMLDRFEEWSAFQLDRFALQVRSLRSVDDLLHEIGDGLPDA